MTSGEASPQPVKRPVIRSQAVAKLSARKKIHARQTTLNVSRRMTMRAPSSVSRGSTYPGRSRRQRSNASPTPWMPPQTMNVHPAPCQSPPSSIVSIRFRYVISLPFRLPPSGM